MTDAALVLIDWQQGFRDASFWGPRNNPEAEENAGRLLSFWRENNWPVIHVRHASVIEGSPLAPGAPGFAFEPFAQPQLGEPVVVKRVNAAFIGTMLEDRLRRAKLRRIVLTGLTTDHCVNTTVRVGANLGFDVTLASDACATHDRRDPGGEIIPADLVHRVTLASLDGEFARVVTTETFLAEFKPTA